MIGRVEIDPYYKGPPKVESFLQKLKSQKSRSRIFKKFNKRWFVLDLNQGTFYYSRKKGSDKIEQSHNVREILRVDPNPQVAITCDWKYVFTVETPTKSYTLYSESQNMHKLWCVALKAVLLPSEAPRPPASSGAAEEYPRRYNSSGYQDEKFYTNPPPSDPYNNRPANQYRNSYQEPASTKANSRGGYNKFDEFPSHPGDVDFQPNRTNPVSIPKEADFRTMPPPSRNEDPYTDNYSDQKRATVNRDPNYREPEPYSQEKPPFKHSSSIREDSSSQVKRDTNEVQARKSDLYAKNDPRPVQRDEYLAEPRDNYRQQHSADPAQYQRKQTPNQWGADPSYNPPRSADYQTENQGRRDYYNPKQEPVSNFDRSREAASYRRPEEYGYREGERKEVPRYDQQSQFQTEPRRDVGYNPLKRDDPPRDAYNSRGYVDSSTGYSSQPNRYEDSYASSSQTKANPSYTEGSYNPNRRDEYQNYPPKSENAQGNQANSWNYSQQPYAAQQRPQYQNTQPRGLNPQGSDKNWDSWDN